jgi:hypothetical protein
MTPPGSYSSIYGSYIPKVSTGFFYPLVELQVWVVKEILYE